LGTFLGIDLGGTNIKFIVVEIQGSSFRELEKGQVPTEASLGPEQVTKRIADLITSCEKSQSIEGVALAVPGIFDHDSGNILLFPNLPGNWNQFPLVSKLTDLTRKNISLINDARAFCLAESTLGAGRGHRFVACIVLGTGVGGGLIIDGWIHEGATKSAGEIAHQVVSHDGPLCGCGTRGCLEALTSSAAISSLAGTENPEEAYKRALSGDRRAIDAFAQVGRWLGIGLANVNAVFSPSIFIVGGGVAQAGNLLLDFIREELHNRNNLWPNSNFEVVPAQLSFFAGATGAALKAAAVAGTQFNFTSIT
jgi:glucokinase